MSNTRVAEGKAKEKISRNGVGPYIPSSGGKYQFMTKGYLRVRIPNPHRGGIGGHLLRAILREAGISVAEWENL